MCLRKKFTLQTALRPAFPKRKYNDDLIPIHDHFLSRAVKLSNMIEK